VPKSGSSALKISIISVVVLLLLGAAGYCGYEFMYKKGPANIVNPPLPNIETPVQKDTVAKDTVKKEEVVAPKPKKKPVAKPKPVVKEEAPVEVKDTTEYQPFV
jgi:outer membrane biosynthesis protein TonB